MSRFGFVRSSAVAIALAAATLASSTAFALDTVKVAYMKIPQLGSIIHGKQTGIFEKHGIDVEMSILNGDSTLMAALQSSSVDVVFTNIGSVLMGRAKGLKVKSFGTGNQESSAGYRNWLIGSQESGTTTLKDLEGKNAGVPDKKSPAEMMIRDHMLRAGADPDKVNFIAMPFPQMAAAIETGNLQAVMVPEPYRTFILESKKIHAVELAAGILASLQDGGSVAMGGWFARDEWLADPHNIDVAKRFLAGILESNRELVADRSLLTAILEKDFAMPPKVANTVAAGVPFETESLYANPEEYTPFIDTLAKTGMISGTYPATDVVVPLGSN